MINKERWQIYLEEFFNCKIKESYYFVDIEGEENVFLLNNGLEVSVKEPNEKN